MSPTVLSNLAEDSIIMKEEIFGPILPMLSFKKISEAINYINKNEKPLTLYLFTKRGSVTKEIISNTSAGSMAINDCVLQFAHPELPFGGIQNSGFGKSHGHHGFMAFSNEKSVLKQRRGFTMAKTLYPPFGRLKKMILDSLIRYF